MKRLLTYGWLLLTLLASLFVMPSCQEDEIPHDTTEVMMTFTTRAVVTQNNESAAIDVEKMDNLRVIVVRENGDIVYNDTRQVDGEPTATVSFQTPVKMGGENFKFFAIANYSSLVNLPDWESVDIDDLITYVEGDGSEISINSPIPQTKYWEYPVKQLLNEIQSITKQLDFLTSKISVQFINTYDAAQTLSDIYITGITPNGEGRLFNHPTGEKDDKGEEIYEEVYVTTNDVTLTDGKIDFGSIGVGAATNEGSTPTSSVIHHYYSYPVDKDNISSPTLHATWNNKTYELPLEGITELKRNDHLKIVVTLTGHALTINYSIAPWVEEPTNIGSPTIGGGYNTEDWTAGGDVNIGGDPVVPDEPEDPVVPGDVIELWNNDEKDLVLNNRGQDIQIDDIYVDYITAGKTLTIYYTCVPDVVWWKIDLQCNGNVILCSEFQYTSEASSKSVQLTEETAGYLKSAIESNKIVFYGNGVSITSICLESDNK